MVKMVCLVCTVLQTQKQGQSRKLLIQSSHFWREDLQHVLRQNKNGRENRALFPQVTQSREYLNGA